MPSQDLVYVGTYTEDILFGTGSVLAGRGRGIHRFRFDAETGALDAVGVTEGVRNPSYLTVDAKGRFLYAVNELKRFEGEESGAVSAFAIDPASGDLTFLNAKASHGTDPCHLVVDPTGRFVVAANYSSGSVCVLPVRDDGALGDATDLVGHEGSGVHPVRQAGPHAHAVVFDASGRLVYVPDLGLDRVVIYRFDPARGTLAPNDPAFVATAPGAGPRQIVLHPNGATAYLINELDSTMTALRVDGSNGALVPFQTLSTLPDGADAPSTCAEVGIAPSGRFLYGSNRGHDSLVVYAVDPADGSLRVVGHESVGGRVPRHFAISPTGAFVLAANQDSGTVVTFAVDPRTGLLRPTGDVAEVPTPTCVRFARVGT